MAIGDEKDFGEFKIVEEFGRKDLMNSLNNGVNPLCLQSKIDELSQSAGSAGRDRQKLIKAAFKVIVENIIPERVRILFNISKDESKATYDDYKRLSSMNQKNFEIENKDSIYSEIDRFHYHTQVDPRLFGKMK